MNRSHPARPSLPCLLCAVALATLPFASVSTIAAPKVEETVVGPVGQVGHYAISERGAHIAWAGAKANSKYSVIVDGVEGPEFDELLRPTGQPVLKGNRTLIGPATQTSSGGYNDGPVIMSVDGEHHAYIGRRGDELVVVHDGREIGRGPATQFVLAENPLTISRGGKQVFWTETDNGMPDPLFRVVVNGKPGPWGLRAGSQGITTSEDGSRYAYPMTTKDNKVALIVDGKDAGYFAQRATFTADGKFLISAGIENKQAVLLVNGKSVATGARIGRIVAASVGSRWAAVVIRKNATHQDIHSLIVDSKEIATGEHVQDIWFSPDGKHYAAACRHFHGRGPDNMVIDGKRSVDYRNLPQDPPVWSPDNSTLIYSATTAAQAPVIVAVTNGKETTLNGTLINVPIAFPQRGSRFALTKRDPRNQIEHIVDGQPVDPQAVAGTFAFSADGSTVGHLSGPAGTTPGTLVVDGKVVPSLATGYFGVVPGTTQSTAFILSPDGKHVASFAREDSIKNLGLWLDGKVVYSTPYPVLYPSFTPDGKHLVWGAEEATGNREKPAMLLVYADGLPAVITDGSFFQRRPDIWTMDDKGVVTFLGADGDVAKRYRISAAPDTSVATLIANGTTMAATPAPKAPPPVAIAPPTPAAPKPAATTPPPPAAVRTAPAATAAAAAAPTPPPAPLTWNDLVRRPEARPVACTVNKDFRFQGGALVRAGTTVNLIQVKPTELVVETQDGRTTFGVKPDETDIVAMANTAWSQLTPAQRELNYPTLLRRTDLWPYRLKLLVSYHLEGTKTRAGDTALLIGLEGGQLLISHEASKLLFNVEPAETDLMAQARAAIASETGVPGRVLEELAGSLVSPIDGRAAPLDTTARPKLVVMYRGAGWCGPCLTFSPQLVKVLKTKAPQPSEVTLIFVSGDRSPAEAKAYATKIGIDWPTIYYKSRDQMPAFNSLFGETIPQLVVTDRHGKVLIDSNRVGTAQALAQLQELL